MIQTFQFRALIAALVLGAAISAAAPMGLASEREKSLAGCWERTEQSAKYPTSLTYCFLKKGKLQGWDIDNGHGADFHGGWKKHTPNQVRMSFKRTTNITCSYEISGGAEALYLKGCTTSSIDGEFKKSNINVQQNHDSPIGCWKKLDAQSRDKNTVYVCLKEKGEWDGSLFDADHGWDIWGKWEYITSRSLLLHLEPSGDRVQCNFQVQAKTKLLLKDCTLPYFSGEFDSTDTAE